MNSFKFVLQNYMFADWLLVYIQDAKFASTKIQ